MNFFERLFRVESPDNRLEGMLMRIGDDFWMSLDQIADDFIPVMEREAETRGIDPLYLYYVFFERPRRWDRAVGDNYRAMELVLEVAQKWSNKYPDWSDYRIPPKSKQRDVDKAVKAVARWANTTWADAAGRLFTKILRSYRREADVIYKSMYEEQLETGKLLCWMNGRMIDAAVRKSRMWPSYGHILWKFIAKLFRDEGLTCPI